MTENAPGGGNAQEKPQYLTKTDVEAMLGDFGKTIDQKVGGAVANQLKKLDIGKSVTDALAAAKQAEADEVAAKGGGKDAGGNKVDPELLALKRQTETLTKSLATEKAAREAAETKSRQQKALGELQAALGKSVRPEALGLLTKAFAADLAFDDDGNAMLPIEGGTTSVSAAIEQWSKSKEADPYRPAPNAGGAGSSKGSGANGAPTSIDAIRAKPRAQWTPAEQKVVFDHNTANNAKSGI